MYCDTRPQFYHWTEPIARKAHRCCECYAPIEKGERYFRVVAKYDGDFFEAAQHLLCAEACMVIRDSKLFWGGECIPFGSLMDHVFDFRLDVRRDAKDGKEDAVKLRSLLAQIKRRERAEIEAARLEAIRPDVEKVRKFGDAVEKLILKMPVATSPEAAELLVIIGVALVEVAKKLKAFGG